MEKEGRTSSSDTEIPHTYTPEERKRLDKMMQGALEAQEFYGGDIDQLERDVWEMRRKQDGDGK